MLPKGNIIAPKKGYFYVAGSADKAGDCTKISLVSTDIAFKLVYYILLYYIL